MLCWVIVIELVLCLLCFVQLERTSVPLQKCCIRFAHIVGNILHTICTYATYYLRQFVYVQNIKRAYAQNMRNTKYILFALYAKYMQNTSMQNVFILHTCIGPTWCICALCYMSIARIFQGSRTPEVKTPPLTPTLN